MTEMDACMQVEVAEIEALSARVKRFRFVACSGRLLPAFSPGSHIVLTMRDGDRTIRNAYSLMGSCRDTESYCISVLLADNSRGGSRYLHTKVEPGCKLIVSAPVNLFPVQRRARKHLMIAGGIGITPFLPMMEEMSQRGLSFELHYSVRDEQGDAYGSELLQRYPADVHLYRTRTGGRMPLRGILELQPLGTHLYVCGPAQMIESVTSQAFQAGWPADSIHFERFAADAGNRHSFEVELAKSKRVLEVSGDQSLLEAIEDAGVEAPYLCRGGACGRCETAVLKGTATLLHRDHYLSDGERAAGNKIMLCVSRASGGRLLLDL